MIPCVVLDLETTGFPNNGRGFCGRIIEVGAVVLTADARVVSPISFFVRQPEQHLRSWQAKKAQGTHGIPVSTVLRDGIAAESAAPRFARWVEAVKARHGVVEVRAYNQTFDFWFLSKSPWDLFERTGLVAGEDIQLTARRALKRKSGPRLGKAVELANEAGSQAQWLSDAHRAEEDARMAALMAVHYASGGDT